MVVVHIMDPGGFDRLGDRRTPYGNPFMIGPACTRAQAIERFRRWWLAPGRAGLRARAKRELRGKRVACHCKPRACHLDVVAETVNA